MILVQFAVDNEGQFVGTTKDTPVSMHHTMRDLWKGLADEGVITQVKESRKALFCKALYICNLGYIGFWTFNRGSCPWPCNCVVSLENLGSEFLLLLSPSVSTLVIFLSRKRVPAIRSLKCPPRRRRWGKDRGCNGSSGHMGLLWYNPLIVANKAACFQIVRIIRKWW